MTVRSALLGAALAAALATIGIGALHLPAAKPWLRALAGGGCPIGHEVPAAVREAARRDALAPFLGDREARARAAFGLALGETRRADLPAWAEARGLTCADDESATVRCTGFDEIDGLRLVFDPTGRLVSLEAAADEADPAAAAARLAARASRIAELAGPPAAVRGDAAHLAAGPLAQAATSFRFADYRVELSATNLGRGRFRVRETHQVP